LALSEEQQTRNYIDKKYVRFDVTDIGGNNNIGNGSELS
jgi:hypothetical protein